MIRQLAVFVLGLGFFLYRVQVYFALRQEKAELRSFLKENDLLDYEVKLHKFGKLQLSLFFKKDVSFAQLDLCHFEMINLSLPSIPDFKSQLPTDLTIVEQLKVIRQLLNPMWFFMALLKFS